MHSALSEITLDNCSYIAYKDYINELCLKLNYDAVVHILSNPYAGEEGNKAVSENNPLNIKVNKLNEKPKKNTLGDLERMGITITKQNSNDTKIPLISDIIKENK